MHIERLRRRLHGGKPIVIITGVKIADMANRFGRGHIKSVFAPINRIFIGHRPPIAPRNQ